MNIKTLLLPLIIFGSITASTQIHAAQPERQVLEVSDSDTISTMLKKQLSKTVTIKLSSGQDITGRIESVGDHLLYISRIRGIEYYDAVIELDNIAGMVVRVVN